MARRKKHRDVEYMVERNSKDAEYFDYFNDAAAAAVSLAISTGESNIDVLVSSRAGARWLGGDDAVEQYDEDPDASVFERFELTINMAGRIP